MSSEPMTHEKMVENFRTTVVPKIEEFAAKLEEAFAEHDGTMSVEEYVERWDRLWGERETVRESVNTIATTLRTMFEMEDVDAATRAHTIQSVGPALLETVSTIERYLKEISRDEAPTHEQIVEALLRRIDAKLDAIDERLEVLEELL